MLFIVLYFVFLSYLDERRHAFPYQSCSLNRSQNLNMEHALGFVGIQSITIKMTHTLMLARSILEKKNFFFLPGTGRWSQYLNFCVDQHQVGYNKHCIMRSFLSVGHELSPLRRMDLWPLGLYLI